MNCVDVSFFSVSSVFALNTFPQEKQVLHLTDMQHSEVFLGRLLPTTSKGLIQKLFCSKTGSGRQILTSKACTFG